MSSRVFYIQTALSTKKCVCVYLEIKLFNVVEEEEKTQPNDDKRTHSAHVNWIDS